MKNLFSTLFFALFLSTLSAMAEVNVLWTQYCVANDTLKLSAHTDADPVNPVTAKASLFLRKGDAWILEAAVPVHPLTASAEFRIEDWDPSVSRDYKVVCGSAKIEGIIRAEPVDTGILKLMAIACVKDNFFPQAKAVAQTIAQDPDLVFFAGDQLYESNSGGKIVQAKHEADIPKAMDNYLRKWRKFGLMFRDLLKDRPSVIITDDHDVYAKDLWGRGGKRMRGDRTTGGYPMHPKWVNLAERTQTWHLPDPVNAGPWGDGIQAYYTSLKYGGVNFAILEDRKFKSAPSEVLSEPIHDPSDKSPNRTMEVIMDPNFDAKRLDTQGLQLLGESQEKFVRKWAGQVVKDKTLSAVLSQSPYANIGNYKSYYGDMDSNGWPQSGRNRALRAITPSQAVMISGDIHYGTILQHGIQDWGDGPWSFSVPAFSSNANRIWKPNAPAEGGEIAGIEGSGNHQDRFGNKLTLTAKADGYQGYGMILFDKDKKTITLEIYVLDDNRDPANDAIPGWPKVIQVR